MDGPAKFCLFYDQMGNIFKMTPVTGEIQKKSKWISQPSSPRLVLNPQAFPACNEWMDLFSYLNSMNYAQIIPFFKSRSFTPIWHRTNSAYLYFIFTISK